jgi:xanthine dehydrogenase accessory factor
VRDALPTLRRWRADGTPFALAVLVERRGSAPREVGAVLGVSASGELAGSITGGCVEPALVGEARAVLAGEGPRLRVYGISDDEAAGVGLMCGGTVAVAVFAPDVDVLDPLLDAVEADRPVALELGLDGDRLGRQRLLAEPTGDAGRLLGADESGILATDAGRRFVATFAPRPQLVVVGAVDHAAAICEVGRFLGFHVTVCDPRAAFVTPERFPAADELAVEWPDRYLERAGLDARSAVCVLTHDPKFDVPAIVAALATPAFYIGAMGSRRTTEDRERRLLETGVTPAGLARIHAPIGLDIGARTPQEVAVSVGAEIVSLRAHHLAAAPVAAGSVLDDELVV